MSVRDLFNVMNLYKYSDEELKDVIYLSEEIEDILNLNDVFVSEEKVMRLVALYRIYVSEIV